MTITWWQYGLLAALSFSGMALSIKKLLTLGLNPIVLNLYLFLFTLAGFTGVTAANKLPLKLTGGMVLFLVLASLCSLAGNFCDVMAVRSAPNPGFAGAIKAGQIVIISIAAVYLFNSSFTAKNLVGVLLILGGYCLLILK